MLFRSGRCLLNRSSVSPSDISYSCGQGIRLRILPVAMDPACRRDIRSRPDNCARPDEPNENPHHGGGQNCHVIAGYHIQLCRCLFSWHQRYCHRDCIVFCSIFGLARSYFHKNGGRTRYSIVGLSHAYKCSDKTVSHWIGALVSFESIKEHPCDFPLAEIRLQWPCSASN